MTPDSSPRRAPKRTLTNRCPPISISAEHSVLHGDPRRCGRAARERTGGSHSALAAARDRPAQPVAVALDRRSAALRLGAVFSLPRIAAAVPAVSAEIHRHVLLDH